MNYRFPAFLILILGSLIAASPLQAASYWVGNNPDNDFNNGNNWNPVGVPAGVIAGIQNGGTAYLSGTGVNALTSLYVGNQAEAGDGQAAGAGNLVQSGGTLTTSSDLYVARATGAQNVGPSAYSISGGTLAVGPAASSAVYLHLATGDDDAGILNISGGTVAVGNVSPGASIGSIRLGENTRSVGIVNQTGGTVITRSAITLGYFNGMSYGYYKLSGAASSLTAQSSGDECTIGQSGMGLFEQSGGNFTVNTRCWVGLGSSGSSTFGVVNLSGGTINSLSTGARTVIGGYGTGVLNIGNSGAQYLSKWETWVGWQSGSTGIINLGAVGSTLGQGGLFRTQGLTRNAGSTVSQLNFHGGTIQAYANNANFLNSSGAGGAVDAYVYSEGGVIDTNNCNITLQHPLLAPGGKGVSSAFTVTNSGSGYQSPPVVKITGGGGKGAAAYAVLAGDQVTSIVLTNPGVGYTGTPTVTLEGGRDGGWWTGHPQVATATASLNTGNSSGGLKKIGAGTLTLSSAGNSYTGATTIEAGTLALSSAGLINASPLIDVKSGAFYDVSAKSGGYNLLGAQTLKGAGTVTGSVVAAAGSTIEPGESPGMLTLTGNLALDGALKIEGSDSAFDRLAVGGTVDLDGGTFDFSGVTAPLTQPSYTFVTFAPGGLTGAAAESSVPTGYHVQYDNSAGTIALVVPEPSALVLLAFGLIGIAASLRRRR
jgi:fibronectin-binding autotransporter adhesin